MNIEQFETTIRDQLTALMCKAEYTVKPEARGYMVTLHIKQHEASKFYTDTAIATYSPQLVKVQVCHLYDQLIQAVLDHHLGEGVLHVNR